MFFKMVQEVKWRYCALLYLCRLVGDRFCLRVDYGHLFGSHLDDVATLMDKKENHTSKCMQGEQSRTIRGPIQLTGISEKAPL